MTEASPSDVRAEYDTKLSDPKINEQITRAAREIRRYNNVDSWDTEKLKDLEASYAAFRIATRIDRPTARVNTGRTRIDREGDVIEELRETVSKLDDSGELVDGPGSAPKASYEVY